MRLLLAKNQVHNPATADVRTVAAAVIENADILAPGILERVGQDGHGTEVATLVHLTGQRHRGAGAPLREEGDGPERGADDFPPGVREAIEREGELSKSARPG